MGIAIFCLILGFIVGYLFKDTQHKKDTPKAKVSQTRNVYLSYNERQRAKNGSKEFKVKDSEDGIPVFLYKAILSSEAIAEDKLSLTSKKVA
ncbi:hypothetical protein B9T26_01920 [Acinetobacter sp. ANC 4169]|uniref:hypothetical protein n=1 Tax=Acinetobacter sp. ANC 4169 TaxID=1977879 RepID=UPI000A34E746|nr:hypothetical protein [Acinetobacter sp. ANC 4169]OTG76588.1 hypothetical protein B9T26_01920 [Acinetobacter sp. ANC 4169]